MRRLVQTVHVFDRKTGTGQPMHAHDKPKNHQGHGVHARKKGVKDKEEEILVVPNANAVVDPRTVMIHFNDASLANTVIISKHRRTR